MSPTVLLYSSHHITEEELAEVIRQAGGVLTPESAARYFGGSTMVKLCYPTCKENKLLVDCHSSSEGEGPEL